MTTQRNVSLPFEMAITTKLPVNANSWAIGSYSFSYRLHQRDKALAMLRGKFCSGSDGDRRGAGLGGSLPA
ncbi:hypothetical protein NW857_09000, partial [Synechococcus sp. H55.9]|uniref:hypothetical protein n=1 Tax=Synechococcus sp. H55.9 TaxID=2964511 RepID=UPI0039C4E4D0